MTLPVLLVTPSVPPERVGAFAALADRRPLEVATYAAGDHHFSASVGSDAFPVRHVDQQAVGRLASDRSRWSAVVAGTAGRTAFPAAWRGSRRAGLPFVVWSAMWHEPSTLAFRIARPLLRRIVRDADAVATYGAHVSAHVSALGARRTFVAPQAVDPVVWRDPPTAPRPPDGPFRVAFVGRDAPGKGLDRLLDAWDRSGLAGDGTELLLVGPDPDAHAGRAGIRAVGPLPAADVRDWLDRSDLLCVPSHRTASFLEPWGLVCNEAMHRGVPVLATDAVGAAAGGLVRSGRNGVVVPADDPAALSAALRARHADRAGTAALGAVARSDVEAYTFDAWADGMAAAIDAAIDARGDRTA
ncbi:MAG: glycosyltransferase family 4 protein [Patulibacter sp.]|nr:glycosyltransferase family 4 protein [Patulibacter sp.]